MSLIVQDLSYIHPNKDFLFQNITFTIPAGEKCAIVKELSFAIIKQAFGRFEEQWRYKKRKNEL